MPGLGCLGSGDPPPTYYAVELTASCSSEAAQLVADSLGRGWGRGGAGLTVRHQRPGPAFPHTVLHLTASPGHLQTLAELLEIRKEDSEGHIRPVTVEDWSAFPETGRVGPLSISDIHRCVQYAMESVHFPEDVTELPGHPGKKVLRGAPILGSYQERRLLSTFPVHDSEDLDRLYTEWSRTTFSPPLNLIRNYFGESVALYWSFADLYTKFLILIALLGLAEYGVEYYGVNYVYSNVLFALFNLLALGAFCEAWKRRSNSHAWYWGTGGKLRLKPARPEYRGELRPSPVTGRQEMFYPASKRVQKILLVSVPLTVLCLVIAAILMFASFAADRMMVELLTDPETGELATDIISSVLSNLPSVAYSLSIVVFNKLYLKMARKLTSYENHRTEEQHDIHITLKLISFEFVNTFLALFYVGLWQGDLTSLRSQLFTTLLVQQCVNQLQEVVIPLLLHKPATIKLLNKMTTKLGISEKPQLRILAGVAEIQEEDDQIRIVNQDILADPLDTLHDDFMELWLQFGHVFLFAAVYPLAAALALLNNLTEIYADRYKLCRLSRKPRPMAVRDIGGWYLAFRLTAVISILTNCSLIALELRDTAGQDWSDLHWYGGFVLLEHVFLLLFLAIDSLVSDTPAEVKLAMDKTEFHFKQMHVKAQ